MVAEPARRGSFTVIERDNEDSREIEAHAQFMLLAIQQAKMAAPISRAFNTGVFIVNGNQPIMGGHSRDPRAPELHAAAGAIAKARGTSQERLLDGATLYTTMEPCSSPAMAKTPCTTHIIQAGIRRVVIGVKEPPEFTNCRGADTLRDAGIDVTHLLFMQEECLKTNIHLLT
ncbi:hypothetical protein GGF46_004621 [Coemansia sp. RSA 552]|nr:hypothetical protein GGF46_004621 [Coemansia sp. RSA 552]